MKALELVEYGRLEVVERPIPEIRPDEVLLQVRACGICGSDVHGLDGSTGRRIPPIIMGHEAAGDIVQVGTEVTDWTVGQRVTLDSTLYCGACAHCLQGQINLCDHRQVLGVSCDEFRRPGAFAEYAAVPARVLYAIPEGVSYEQAAMTEPVSVASHAVRRACVQAGEQVALFGAGMIGQFVIQVLRSVGAEVTAFELEPWKRELAEQFGSRAWERSPLDASFDVVIDAVGIPATVDAAIRTVRKGGRVALVGNLSPKAEIPLQMVVNRELDLLGCCASQGEYPESLRLIQSGQVDVRPMLSARTSLDDAAHWFEELRTPGNRLMKVLVCP